LTTNLNEEKNHFRKMDVVRFFGVKK